MRSKAIIMALLALAFGAQGAPVSDATARLAAGSWAVSDASLGVPHGTRVGETRAYSVDGTNGFYAVSLEGGGTLFLAADDEIDPVLGFTSAADVDLSERSPLRNLLCRDIAARRGKLSAESQPAPAQRVLFAAKPATAPAAEAAESRAKKLWSALTEDTKEPEGGRVRLAATAAPRKSIAVSDIRVEPFLTSQWSQEEDKLGNLCYNYYTPSNYPCGCVATAAGQILYRWKWPQGDLPKFTGDCMVNSKSVTLESHGDSRLYDWDAMVGVPGASTTDASRQAIGALLYDLGVAFKANYTQNSTGAYEKDVPGPLREHFGYASAYTYSVNGTGVRASSLHNAPTRQRAILANLDAKRPVELYILSKEVGGHAVVADGYGYVNISGEEVEFTHINMGWAGTDDMWYNLPVIQTEEAGSQSGQSGGYTFEYLMGATFNIHPTETGDLLTGRITDDEGALPGAIVSVYAHGSLDAPIATTNSDEHGIYCFVLTGGEKYDIVASTPDGSRTDMLEGVTLRATTVADTTTYVTQSADDIGNSWGNDIALLFPRARIVTGAETNGYTTLDLAIAGARAIAASSGGVPEIEILRDIELRSDATVDFNCVIRAASGEESSTQVNRPTGAMITVASGAALTASNCVFAATGRVPLVAEAGGRVVVGPGFVAERVATTDASGFNVAGFVTSDIAVECKAATAVGHVFGMATTDDPAALTASVARLYATFDEERAVRGALMEVSPAIYYLVWAGVPVPVGSSVGYYVAADGTTNAFASADSLFSTFESALSAGIIGPAPEIVLRGRDEKGLSRDIVVSTPLVIRGEPGAFLMPLASSHIVVTNGGSLVVRDLVIGDRDPTGDTFVRILDGGSMALAGGASLTNIVCAGNYDSLEAGPVAVMNGGTLRIETGASIVGCKAIGAGSCNFGGGVCVKGGGTLDLAGGAIEGCYAQYGGGVYAHKGANIVVSGPSSVANNLHRPEKTDKASDIYFNNLQDKVVVRASAAGGAMGIRYATGTGNAAGFTFADASALSSAHDIDASAAAFFNDANDPNNPERLRRAEADGTDIKWVLAGAAPSGLMPIDQSDPAEMALAVAKVGYPDGSTEYWKSVQDAFASLEGETGAATVTLLQDDWFDEDIAVYCDVAVASSGSVPLTLSRREDVSIEIAAGASLTAGNITFGDEGYLLAESPLLLVDGGSLVFDGAKVCDVVAEGRFGAAVTVVNGGTLTMRNGASITDCMNVYAYESDKTGYAAAVLADGSSVVLEKCSITDCMAYRIGGVCVDNGGRMSISGEASVSGNYTFDGDDANVIVAASASLCMVDTFTGSAGVRRDIAADRVVFGRVGDTFSGTDADLVASAMNFTSDDGLGFGLAARAADGTTLLVWSERIGSAGKYVDGEGVEYALVTAGAVPFRIEPPTAVDGLVYNGAEQIGVEAGFGYTLENAAATAAGDYEATATLAAGCVWTDGTSAPKAIAWSIEKDVVDLSGIVFSDATFLYDGTPKQIAISGELPNGVTVAYSIDGNDWSQPGRYTVTAKFTMDGEDYEPIPDMTATMTILRPVECPTANTGLVYNAHAQTGVADGEGFSLSGDVTGTDAGTNYTVVVSLDDYMAWSDGSTNDLEIVWSINPAPLAIVAANAWKYVDTADPLPFAYRVDGLQGGDTAADVLVGALDRVPGEDKGVYGITQGDLRIADGVVNYFIDGFTLGKFTIRTESMSVLPDLPAGATAGDVAQALADAGLTDGDVAGNINNADDPVAAYNDFKDWANTVAGGEEDVAASDHAWESYEFGVTELFQNEPTVTISSMAIQDPAEASMRVVLVVKDGGAEKAVDPDSVAKLFEMSADLVTWTDDVTATPNGDGSYTVKPNDSTLKAAFIRLKY